MSPFLLFVHGAAGTGQVWQAQLLDFPRSVAPDLPGHPSGPPLPSVEAYAAWLVDYARAQRLPRPVLVGHSMGGAVALEAALQAPAAFSGLVLVATGARLPVHPRFLRGLADSPGPTLERFVELWFGPHAPARVREKVSQCARQLGPQLLRQDLEACHAFDARARLKDCALPTLVLCGEADRMTPPELSLELHRGIPTSSLVVVPEAGHMVFVERRRLFRDSVRTFLATVAVRG